MWIIHTLDSALADESNSKCCAPETGGKKTRRTLEQRDLSQSWVRTIPITDRTVRAVTLELWFSTRAGPTQLRLPDFLAASGMSYFIPLRMPRTIPVQMTDGFFEKIRKAVKQRDDCCKVGVIGSSIGLPLL